MFYVIADDSGAKKLGVSPDLLSEMAFGKVLKADCAIAFSPDIKPESLK